MKKTLLILTLVLSGTLCFSSPDKGAVVKLFEKGLMSQSREEWFEASEQFQQVLQINPSYGDAWFHLAQVTYELNDFNLAITYLENAEKYAKDSTEIRNLRGNCYISLGELEKAKEVFDSVLKKYPNDINARFGLAELKLFTGNLDGAKLLYQDALKRQNTNRKALLSLALLSAETQNFDKAQDYVNKALKYHSNDANVHFFASYLAAKQNKITLAEKYVRSAVQIKGDYNQAYVLLGNLLFQQKRYSEVIDISDYLIAKDRNTASAWYLKGLSLRNNGQTEEAIETWTTALTINEQDEVMRSALELLVNKTLSVEDERRSIWADYHIKKAREYAKMYQGVEARYEYQRALRLDPSNVKTRSEFAETLAKLRLNELYLHQLKFIQNINKGQNPENFTSEELAANRKIDDTIEAYDALMKYTLNTKWDVNPFYLDKTRWNIGLYCKKSQVQLVHAEAEDITSQMAAEIFSGVATTSVSIQNQNVSGYGEAFKMARNSNLDYFVVLEVFESEREISIEAVMYSGRTGTETSRISVFRTGNDRYASVLRSFRRAILENLSIRGKILKRSGNEVLLDLGKSEGVVEGTVLDLVKKGNIRTADKGPGVIFDSKYGLGQITVEKVGEEICSGRLEQNGFYDRVNIGDEVIIKFMPKKEGEESAAVTDTTPKADEAGNKIDSVTQTARELGLIRTPAVVDIIRSIQ